MRIHNVVHRGLRRFIERDDPSGLPAVYMEKIRNIITYLQDMDDIGELAFPPKWACHQLGGNRKGAPRTYANLATVMLLAPGGADAQQSPDRIYANGISHFVENVFVNAFPAEERFVLALQIQILLSTCLAMIRMPRGPVHPGELVHQAPVFEELDKGALSRYVSLLNSWVHAHRPDPPALRLKTVLRGKPIRVAYLESRSYAHEA